MAFIVEDGTGKTDSNAYIEVQYYKDYLDDRGRSYAGHTDEDLQHAIVSATSFLTDSFAWKGYRRYGRSYDLGGGTIRRYQAQAWPRYGVYDNEENYVDDDVVPREVMEATVEVTAYILANGAEGLVRPVFTPHDRVKMEKAGPVSVQYDTSRKDAYGVRPVLLVVLDLIGEFTKATGRYSAQAVRV